MGLYTDCVLKMTIAQIVYDNEKSFGYTDDEIHEKVGMFRGSFLRQC